MDNQGQKIIYKKVVVNGETLAGETIQRTYPPSSESPTWRIVLKNNTMIEATGNVQVWTKAGI